MDVRIHEFDFQMATSMPLPITYLVFEVYLTRNPETHSKPLQMDLSYAKCFMVGERKWKGIQQLKYIACLDSVFTMYLVLRTYFIQSRYKVLQGTYIP